MRHFSAKYPKSNEQEESFAFPADSDVGNTKDCIFYTASSSEKRGVAFRLAFDAATECTNHKELCAYVGSMLCAVSDDLKNSVLEALHGVGVQPRYETLSHTDEAGAAPPQMDWPSILVNFGCICILLLKNTEKDITNEASYQTFMTSCIGHLQRKVGYEPATQMNVPFDFPKANVIKTMLGACLSLRTAVVTFIIGTMSMGRGSTHSVCGYLFNIISWTGMDELILMKEMLVIPGSSILRDPLYSKERENLLEAIEAIEDHPYPQFFMHLASNMELLKVELSRFPTLIDFAQEMMRVAEENRSNANSQHRHRLQMMNPAEQVQRRKHKLWLCIFLILCFCFVLLFNIWAYKKHKLFDFWAYEKQKLFNFWAYEKQKLFNFWTFNKELLKLVQPSRFPTLIESAKRMELERQGCFDVCSE